MNITYYDTYTSGQPVKTLTELRETSGNSAVRTIYTFFDSIGRPIQTKQESGNLQNIVQDTVYDGLGRTIKSTQPRYVTETSGSFDDYTNIPTNVVSETLSYDALGRVKILTQYDGTQVKKFYGLYEDPSLGWTKTVDTVDTLRHRTQVRNDALNREVKLVEMAGNCSSTGLWSYTCGGSFTTNWTEYASTTTTYSVVNLPTAVKDNLNNTTTANYDTARRVSSVNSPDRGTWNYIYDMNKHVARQVDAKGQTLYFESDAQARQTARRSLSATWSDTFSDTTMTGWTTAGSVAEGSGVVVITGNNVDYTANASRSAAAPSDKRGITVNFKVSDVANATESLLLDSGTWAQSDYRRWAIMVDNNMLKLNKYVGTTSTLVDLMPAKANTWYKVTLFTDSTHRFSIVVEERDQPTLRSSYQEKHDDWSGRSWRFSSTLKTGTLTLDDYSEVNGQDQAAYIYDTGTNGDGHLTKVSNADATTTWTYDTRGRITSIAETVSGLTPVRTFSWAYDAGDRVSSITYPTNETVSYSYDAAWRPTQLCSNQYSGICYVTSANYTALNKPTQWTLGNGLGETITYNSTTQRLSRIQLGTLFDQSYTYDTMGKLTGIDDTVATGMDHTFNYDHRNRLTADTVMGETFSYDTIGNLTQRNTTTYTYGTQSGSCAAGALSKPHARITAPTTNFCYDQNGDAVTGAGRTYTRNILGLPTSITDGSVTENYVYTAQDQRVKVTTGSTSKVTLQGLWQETIGGATKTQYIFNGQVVAQRESGTNTVLYFQYDVLNNLVLSTTAAGAEDARQGFDAWGLTGGSIQSTQIASVEDQVDGTGLRYSRGRYYDPTLAHATMSDRVTPKVLTQNTQSGIGDWLCRITPWLPGCPGSQTPAPNPPVPSVPSPIQPKQIPNQAPVSFISVPLDCGWWKGFVIEYEVDSGNFMLVSCVSYIIPSYILTITEFKECAQARCRYPIQQNGYPFINYLLINILARNPAVLKAACLP